MIGLAILRAAGVFIFGGLGLWFLFWTGFTCYMVCESREWGGLTSTLASLFWFSICLALTLLCAGV